VKNSTAAKQSGFASATLDNDTGVCSLGCLQDICQDQTMPLCVSAKSKPGTQTLKSFLLNDGTRAHCLNQALEMLQKGSQIVDATRRAWSECNSPSQLIS